MARKNEKNCRKDNTANTTIQTSRNCKDEVKNCKTEHPDNPNVRN